MIYAAGFTHGVPAESTANIYFMLLSAAHVHTCASVRSAGRSSRELRPSNAHRERLIASRHDLLGGPWISVICRPKKESKKESDVAKLQYILGNRVVHALGVPIVGRRGQDLVKKLRTKANMGEIRRQIQLKWKNGGSGTFSEFSLSLFANGRGKGRLEKLQRSLQ